MIFIFLRICLEFVHIGLLLIPYVGYNKTVERETLITIIINPSVANNKITGNTSTKITCGDN